MSRGLGGGLSMMLNHHLFFVCVVVGSMSLSHPNVFFFLHVWWLQGHHPLFLFVDRQETEVACGLSNG